MKNKKGKVQQKKVVQKQQSLVPESIKKPQNEDKKNQKILIVVGAKPNSKQSKISQINDQYVGINIGAPPKEGQANQQLLSHLSYVLGVKKNCVYLDKGAKCKHKVVVIESNQLTTQSVYDKLMQDMSS